MGDFNGGILFDPFGECRLWYAILLAELGLCFAILVERDKRFFKIFVIFVIVVSSHVSTS